jgi:hypothetical protein
VLTYKRMYYRVRGTVEIARLQLLGLEKGLTPMTKRPRSTAPRSNFAISQACAMR